ncbi:MAG: HD family phosphohydrolase [Symploca sp. SIO1C2]|nr:HD family phosphohydrolase [Symploca sp. SIO1C2]NER50928.1 HD family phosphohydrolase [Symploca sp. SIO1A3]
MKTLHSLTQPLTKLRRKSENLRAWLSLRVANSLLRDNLSAEPKRYDWPKRRKSKSRPPMIWAVAVISLTSVMGNRYYNQPGLDVGTIAPEKVIAPQDADVEDKKTTEEKRKEASTGIVPVLMLDESVTEEIQEKLDESLSYAEELRESSGSLPFVNTAILTDATQKYLRESEELEWHSIQSFAKSDTSDNFTEQQWELPEQVEDPIFIQAVNELQNYRQLSSREFSQLIDQISQAREDYQQALRQLLEYDSEHPYDISLLELSDEVWLETVSGISTASQRILAQGIPPGLPDDILAKAVQAQVNTLVPSEAESIAIELLSGILQPNLQPDPEQTKLRAEQAAQQLPPVMVSVEKGEVIVEAGEEITQEDFVLLDHFGESQRGINWPALIGFGSLVTGATGIFFLVERRVHPSLRRRDHILVFLLSLTTPVLVIFGVPFTSLPAIGLLVGSFYGSSLGVTVVGLLTGLVGFSMEFSWEALLSGAAGGVLGSWLAARLRSREELALLGGAVGLTQASVHLILNLIISAAAGLIWYTALQSAVLYGLAGLSWSIVALGVSPYLERLFDLVTPIRLAELSNPNRTLLKRLATQAPGTFQHTMFVASLAEAAARELHCNVELVRAGTLYHDIGKMHDPLGFIENQMGGPNKHDEINDPSKSAQIIKKHVSEGLVMARRHGLPQAIRDFIPEHQGTLLISYFYFQAQQQSEQEGLPPVLEADFRYDGPIPQSRETGIVMLADACEAALRSLQDVTPETAFSMVKKILKARWQDNQLLDSGITREELPIIAEVFVRVWQQCNHKRIVYPKAALNYQSSVK